jgi:hypothetical protein
MYFRVPEQVPSNSPAIDWPLYQYGALLAVRKGYRQSVIHQALDRLGHSAQGARNTSASAIDTYSAIAPQATRVQVPPNSAAPHAS